VTRQTKNMTLVANRGGRRKVLWGQLIKIAMLLVPVAMASISLTYLILVGRWNPLAAWLGLGAGLSIVTLILLAHFITPLSRMPHIR